jgi:hypothetical protein
MLTLTGHKLTMQDRQKCAKNPTAAFEGAAEHVYMGVAMACLQRRKE